MSNASASFVPVEFADLPGWEDDDHACALSAFRNSRAQLAGVEGRGRGTTAPAEMHQAFMATSRPGAAELGAARHFFESRFRPHRVMHDRPNGLLTGYYEPVVLGSRVPQGCFQTPIHRRPPDLVNLVEESLRGTTGSALTHARMTPEGPVPYATRAEIESGALAGNGLELFYLSDPVEAFFMQVQGSGRIVLPDGTSVRVTYDGKNGHPYSSIGRHLVETGALGAEDVSLATIARWLRADPARGQAVMWRNASYVFFRELVGKDAGAARGVMDVPLTPGRSLAVDAGVHALGTPIFVVAPSLGDGTTGRPFQRLMIAQDVGSAITGPERGDIYFGSGDEAARQAGTTRHAGNFFVLLPLPTDLLN